jgi:hypothetical protein
LLTPLVVITQVVKYRLLSQHMIREGYPVSDLEGSFTVYLYIYTYVFTHGLDAFRY